MSTTFEVQLLTYHLSLIACVVTVLNLVFVSEVASLGEHVLTESNATFEALAWGLAHPTSCSVLMTMVLRMTSH
jgi:hypothetical protein